MKSASTVNTTGTLTFKFTGGQKDPLNLEGIEIPLDEVTESDKEYEDANTEIEGKYIECCKYKCCKSSNNNN